MFKLTVRVYDFTVLIFNGFFKFGIITCDNQFFMTIMRTRELVHNS